MAYCVSKQRQKSRLPEKIIYQILFRTFTTEGTIAAATKKLEDVAAIGVDILYLSPFCEADPDPDTRCWSERQKIAGTNNPKNPYRICDYFKIDEEYGTEDDFAVFIKKAHDLGLKVFLDLVYTHCGPGKFTQKNPDFVMRDFEGNIQTSRYGFPNLNFENAELREYLWSNMLYWIAKFDIDGYRCDVGDKVPLDFWAEGRKRIEKIKPELYLINEGENPDYLCDVFDTAYYNHDCSWNAVIHKKVSENPHGLHHTIRMIYEGLSAGNPDGAVLLRAYENHDFANDSWGKRLDRIHPKIVDALMVLNFTIDGIPMIYSGNEFADFRRHSIFRKQTDAYCVDWSVRETDAGRSRFVLTRKLCDLRHHYRVLSYGKTKMEKTPDLLIYERKESDTVIRVALRFEESETEYFPKGHDILLSGNCRKIDNIFYLGKGGYVVELLKKKKNRLS